MAVYLEFIADTPEQLAEAGVRLDTQRADVELTCTGDVYLSIDLRVDRAEPDALTAGVGFTPGATFDDIDQVRREELDVLNLARATIAGRAEAGDAQAVAHVESIDERRAALRGVDNTNDAPVETAPQPAPAHVAAAVKRPSPGTCPATVLDVIDAEPDRDWPIADIVAAVTAKGFTDGTVKVSLTPLLRDGFLSRPRPGVYRSTVDD
jgi:hypothetical protein